VEQETQGVPTSGFPWREVRTLGELGPSSSQSEVFDDLSEAELEERAREIEQNGSKHPIRLLP
jgi:hypothetical protein